MRIIVVGSQHSDVARASVEAASKGADVRSFERFAEALEAVADGAGAELLLLDVHSNIKDAIERLTSARIFMPVIAYGRDCQPRDAAAAIRAGAKDYLPLPPDAELIAAILASVAEEQDDLVFDDPMTGEVVQLARQIAPTDASVLITGESGTGKEVFARLVHRHSRRKDAAFVSVNCAAIPENLLESELFGHEKGAFTGALSKRVGKFEEAHGGTLLLDEISEMDVRLQAKLLRAIQEREIDRVGGTKPIAVDIRLLATSNRDLAKAVAEGSFREDLLFRLNVMTLELPPLRERPRDIAVLARFFADRHSANNGLTKRRIGDDAAASLRLHHWPGNVRELENCMHRAVLLAMDGVIEPRHLRLPDPQPLAVSANNDAQGTSVAGGLPVGRTVAEVERDLILGTLDHTEGNRTHAARILGISIRTLRNKLNQYERDGVFGAGALAP